MKPKLYQTSRRIITLSIAIILSISAKAQSPILAGFDTTQFNPVFIQSQDGQYNVHLGMYTQFRYNATFQANTPDSISEVVRGYNLARTRIFLEGNLTERFYFHTRVNINPTGTLELMIAYLQWNLNEKMWIRGGKQFMALGREDWMFPQDLASVELSANDFTYAIWTSFGFQFRHVPSDKFRYFLSVGNGAYGGRQGFPAPNPTDFTFIGRGEWNILGGSWDNWDDMVSRRGRKLGMLLGFSGGSSNRQKEQLDTSDYSNASQFNLDYSVAGNGFHFFVAASMTTRNYEDAGLNNSVNGMYATLGYWLCKSLFAYGRFDFVGKGDVKGASEDYIAPGFGISYYPFQWTNRTRFTLEYNYLDATISNTIVAPDGQLGWTDSPFGNQQAIRLQLQFGF